MSQPATAVAPFRPASFEQDTLIFALGNLAESVVRMFCQEPESRDRYEAWLRQAQLDPDQAHRGVELIETGTSAGQARLVARATRGQFLVRCTLPDANAVVCIGFDVDHEVTAGVHVASAEGSWAALSAFATRLSRVLQASCGEGHPLPAHH